MKGESPFAPWVCYRYSRNPSEAKLTPVNKPAGGLHIRIRGGGVSEDPVIYLTPDRQESMEKAHRFLGITYWPSHGATYALGPSDEPILKSNLFEDVTIDPVVNQIANFEQMAILNRSRVWPAYGQPGGAHELLLTGGSLTRLADGPTTSDGAKDYYAQQDVDLFVRFRHQLASIFSGVLTRFDIGAAFAKLDENGLVIRLGPAGQNPPFYSISVGLRSERTIQLKLWGYAWFDEQVNTDTFPTITVEPPSFIHRYVVGPTVKYLDFVDEFALKKSLMIQGQVPPAGLLSASIAEILTELRGIRDVGDVVIGGDRFPIPPPLGA